MKYSEQKFILVLSTLVFFYIISANLIYIINATINWKEYSTSIIKTNFSAMFGFFFIYLSLKTTRFKLTYRNKEAHIKHAALDLLSAIPEAPYIENGLHPLESEILTALKAYQTHPCKDGENLYRTAFRKWEYSKSIPNATHLHRIAALSSNLSALYAYSIKKEHPRLWLFWKKSKILIKEEGKECSSTNAHILSRFPSFQNLSEREQTALLYSLKYVNKKIPDNKNIPEITTQLISFIKRLESK